METTRDTDEILIRLDDHKSTCKYIRGVSNVMGLFDKLFVAELVYCCYDKYSHLISITINGFPVIMEDKEDKA